MKIRWSTLIRIVLLGAGFLLGCGSPHEDYPDTPNKAVKVSANEASPLPATDVSRLSSMKPEVLLRFESDSPDLKNEGFDSIIFKLHGATSTPSGKDGRAMQFDSKTPSYVSTDKPVIAGASGFTVSLWVNSTGVGSQTIYSETSDSSSIPLLQLQTVSAGSANCIRLFVRDDKNRAIADVRSSLSAPNDTWIQVVLVRDGEHGRLYIDGKPDPANFGYTVSKLSANQATIGAVLRQGVPLQPFSGMIDNFGIYATPLQ